MPISLRIVEPPAPGISWYEPKAGEMWLCSWNRHKLPGRAQCFVIRLPGEGYCWHTNSESSNENAGLWNVIGEPPNITVTPSINIGPDIWHGFITNGELTVDTDKDGNT